jgi:glycine hydroxymethyltransferase
MKEEEMDRIAEFIADTIIKDKDKDKIKKEIIEFKKDFLEVKYTYELSNMSPNST